MRQRFLGFAEEAFWHFGCVRKLKDEGAPQAAGHPRLCWRPPNQRWSLDFVHDQFVIGHGFRVLDIVDDVTRKCRRAVVDTSTLGRRVVRELTELIAERGEPKTIVSDNGTELTSNAVLAWSGDVGVEWHYIAPGKPTQNGFVESFHGGMPTATSDRARDPAPSAPHAPAPLAKTCSWSCSS